MSKTDIFVLNLLGPIEQETTSVISVIENIKPEAVQVNINSFGGDVFAGFTIYNFLKSLPKVEIHVLGVAASIAGVVALASQELYIAKGGFLMLHEPTAVVSGNSKVLRARSDLLSAISEAIDDIYATKTRKTKEEIRAWMEAETWIGAEEAVDLGLAKKLLDKTAATNSYGFGIFKNLPKGLKMDDLEFKEVFDKGRQTERERLKGIASLAITGTEEIVAELQENLDITVEQAAVKILQYLKNQKTKALSDRISDVVPKVPSVSVSEDGKLDFLSEVEACMASENCTRIEAMKKVILKGRIS